MTPRQATEAASAFADTVLFGPKVIGALAVVVSAFAVSFTSVLAVVLTGLFLADITLGSLRAVAGGGLNAFCWEKWWRAWIKMIAAIVGLAVFTLGDVLLHEMGLRADWHPTATAGLTAMCWGFFFSALQNVGYFFPAARRAVEAVTSRFQPPGQPMQRRSTDG